MYPDLSSNAQQVILLDALKIDDQLDTDVLAAKPGFEVASEEADCYVIVASEALASDFALSGRDSKTLC